MNSLFSDNLLPLAFWSPGPAEMLVLGVVALLLYGGNLPEVARSWGKTFAEFRRGLTGFQTDLNEVIYSEPDKLEYRDDSLYPNGYEEPDVYQEEEDTAQDESEAEQNDGDESDKKASKDTVAEKNPAD